MTISPIRDGNLTASAATAADIMATYYADVVANSTWTVQDQIEIGSAQQTLTLTGQPLNTETVIADVKTYTFQTTLTNVDGNVLIGATFADSLDNLRAAICLHAGAGTAYATAMTLHPTLHADDTATTLVVTALAAGVAGNSIATTETLTNGSWGSATLAGGDASSPGAGSFSCVLRSPDSALELVFINAGTPVAPSTTDVLIGINPDGSTDPVKVNPGDSMTPWLTAASFSGESLAVMRSPFRLAGTENAQFYFHEFSDTIGMTFKNAGRTATPRAFLYGKPFVFAYSHMANPGGGNTLRCDGHGGLGYVPSSDYATSAADERYGALKTGTTGNACLIRVSEGQVMGEATGEIGAAWNTHIAAQNLAGLDDTAFGIGKDDQYQPTPQVFAFQIAPAGATLKHRPIICKYLAYIKQTTAMTKLQDDSTGEDLYLSLSYDGAVTAGAIVVRDGFLINP